MAIDVVDQALEVLEGQPIYVYHEIVHNKHVVGRFRDRGVTFVESIDDVPEGSIVVFSAHGVSPQVRQEADQRRLTWIDATCPLVTKVHAEAIRYARQGYQILLVGHRNHQEIIGTAGEAPDATQVVESPDDIPNLHIVDPDRLVYLTQTTLSTDDAQVIIDALRAAFPNIKAPPGEDICYATTNRQAAVRQIAPECDLVLVVGSGNSSNSVRLTEIAATAGTPAYLIDDASGLRDEWIVPKRAVAPTRGMAVARHGHADQPQAPESPITLLLTAGASAPEDLVAGVCRELLARFGGTIETRDIVEEDVEFGIPATLKRLMRDRGIDPADRRIRVAPPDVTRETYGAVPLTISAGDGRH
ncbi:MAG: 4-hydroxy-3-methylbut-2-enyl diphosphate reductase [Phycisphaeraceae bacterium]|nr:4-hydroxy-3-methylbut-2-enyl diphosphate reductase [Phycisphaeraceae bacterium]